MKKIQKKNLQLRKSRINLLYQTRKRRGKSADSNGGDIYVLVQKISRYLFWEDATLIETLGTDELKQILNSVVIEIKLLPLAKMGEDYKYTML